MPEGGQGLRAKSFGEEVGQVVAGLHAYKRRTGLLQEVQAQAGVLGKVGQGC